MVEDSQGIRSGSIDTKIVLPFDASRSDVADERQSNLPAVPAELVDTLVEAEKAAVGLMATNEVDHPPHYCHGRKFEPIDVIEDWDLGYHLGNAVKYISRAGRKDDELVDLKKAIFYIKRRIKQLEAE